MTMSDFDALLGKKHFERTRLKVFLHHAEAIGMMEDYERIFLISEKSLTILGYGYFKLLKTHKRGYNKLYPAEWTPIFLGFPVKRTGFLG